MPLGGNSEAMETWSGGRDMTERRRDRGAKSDKRKKGREKHEWKKKIKIEQTTIIRKFILFVKGIWL